jgi:hypothetical protein
VEAAPGEHVSTEAEGFPRHVECADCHNVHEATSTVPPAPAALGAVAGAWGVSVLNPVAGPVLYSLKRGVEFEYQLCLKCHDDGTWSGASETRDIASEVSTQNASYHSVEAVSSSSQVMAGSFVGGGSTWANDSMVRCTDCHGNAEATESPGPHVSPESPLLLAPYVGLSPADQNGLCYVCHKYNVYYTGTEDDAVNGSRFWMNKNPNLLHESHTETVGIGCAGCHVTHGGTQPHLMRADIGYVHSPGGGGECTNACHAGATNSYEGR